MRNLIFILGYLFTLQAFAASPMRESKEDEQYSLQFLEKLEKAKPELFRAGEPLSRKMILSEWTNNEHDDYISFRYVYEYQYSDGWLVAKIYFPKKLYRGTDLEYEITKTTESVNGYRFHFSGDEQLTIRPEQEQISEDDNKEYFVKKFADGEERRASIVSKLETKSGVLRVVDREQPWRGYFGFPDTLLLDGSEIFTHLGEFISLHGAYLVGDKTYVLIGENCGGTGCRFDDLSFLELNGHDKARIISNGDFHGDLDKITVSQEDNKIIVDLDLEKKQLKKAVLENGVLTITRTPVPYSPMTEVDCGGVYDTYSNECPKKFMPTCGERFKDVEGRDAAFSNHGMWELRYATNNPGFNGDGFYTECVKACETGQTVDFKTFYDSACKLDAH